MLEYVDYFGMLICFNMLIIMVVYLYWKYVYQNLYCNLFFTRIFTKENALISYFPVIIAFAQWVFT